MGGKSKEAPSNKAAKPATRQELLDAIFSNAGKSVEGSHEDRLKAAQTCELLANAFRLLR